jgi:nitrite reductase/ring-hydroxylating ferredoxin subunit
MTHQYKAVGWNRQKRIYDGILFVGIVLYLSLFIGGSVIVRPNGTIETALIRGFGSCALLLLHVILSIGPLARLDGRFLVLLYNRRHLGVTMFIVALAHGVLSIVQFHGFSLTNPLVNLFTANTRYDSLAQFPFQPLGFVALVILFLMAATSHDFWLANLTAPWWKRLHMLVYVAYGLLIAHVALGALQSQTNPVLATFLGIGVAWILSIHLIAGQKERRADRQRRQAAEEGFVDVCAIDAIPDGRAHTATIGGDRVGVFRYDDKISAVSNACRHQNGPLGEGRIVNGCIVCPWHGYEYKPESGQSPPPFTEKIPTFNVRIVEDRVWIHPSPNPPGTFVEPAKVQSQERRVLAPREDSTAEFYVGYKPRTPPILARFARRLVWGLVAGSAILSLTLASTQERFDAGFFEFGNQRSFSGSVSADPYPVLSLIPPGAPDQAPDRFRFLLVGIGKRGAEAEIEPFLGSKAELDGTLVYRDDVTMVEIVPDSTTSVTSATARTAEVEPRESLGIRTLTGEIVDMKCYLGVMKPGRGKTHKACAINCIRGGIPPVLVVSNGSGPSRHYILVDGEEDPVNERVLEFVAEPIEITGEVVRKDNLHYLKADPSAYRRLAGS